MHAYNLNFKSFEIKKERGY